jgi:hypothetical protein
VTREAIEHEDRKTISVLAVACDQPRQEIERQNTKRQQTINGPNESDILYPATGSIRGRFLYVWTRPPNLYAEFI